MADVDTSQQASELVVISPFVQLQVVVKLLWVAKDLKGKKRKLIHYLNVNHFSCQYLGASIHSAGQSHKIFMVIPHVEFEGW